MSAKIIQFPKRQRRASGRRRIYDEPLVPFHARVHPQVKEGIEELALHSGMNVSEFTRALMETAINERWKFKRVSND